MLPIVLASSSSYRKELLKRLHLNFTCNAPNIDETPHPNETPQQLTQRLSKEKTLTLANHYPNHLIIGSDQVASLNGQIIGKPLCFEKAQQQLKAASGNTVCFYTGIALLNTQTKHIQIDCIPFHVHFRTLSEQTITNYLKIEQPYDCAGSFKAEGLGISLFKSTQGEDNTSLIGLPLIRLIDMLLNEGVSIP